jgi:hypothetical protein
MYSVLRFPSAHVAVNALRNAHEAPPPAAAELTNLGPSTAAAAVQRAAGHADCIDNAAECSSHNSTSEPFAAEATVLLEVPIPDTATAQQTAHYAPR